MALDAAQHQLEDVAADVVEVDFYEALGGLLEFLLEVGRLVVDADVCAEAFDLSDC